MYQSSGSLLTWASIPLWSGSLYMGRYLCRIRRACCLKMAVMYAVLSTADTGFVKTLYTKITPSSEVVPAKKESGDSINFYFFTNRDPTSSGHRWLQQLGLVWVLPSNTDFSFCQWPFWKAVTACSFIKSPSMYGPQVSKTSRNLKGFTSLEPEIRKYFI